MFLAIVIAAIVILIGVGAFVWAIKDTSVLPPPPPPTGRGPTRSSVDGD